jgi:hypothetical protein
LRNRSAEERQAVEFGVEIGEYSGVVRVPRSSLRWSPATTLKSRAFCASIANC